MVRLELNAFPDTTQLDHALAERIATALAAGIASNGRAALAVSGGRTPGGFFRALSQHTLDWSRIIVTLADERCVAESDPASNARSVREHLLQGPAASAQFLPLHLPGESTEELLERLGTIPAQFDAVILGMGDDAHTASIFPDSPQRDAALSASAPAALAVEGKAPVRERITLSAQRLLATRLLCLHITGLAKWQVLGETLAESSPERPISFFLHNRNTPAHVFWTP
jgi:6-phosphogluconolactonase